MLTSPRGNLILFIIVPFSSFVPCSCIYSIPLISSVLISGISEAELTVEESDQSDISTNVKEIEYFLVHAAVNASKQAEESDSLSVQHRNKVLSDESAL